MHQKQGYPQNTKGLDKAPVFTSNTTTFTDQRDYRFKSGQQVSLTTVNRPVDLRICLTKGFNSSQHVYLRLSIVV